MKKSILLFVILFTSIANAQTYFPLRNVETNLESFSGINGQWIAVTPTNNHLTGNYYQGLNFGFDVNNYASLVNAIGTNDLYFGRWDYAWKGWSKIWHSGNLNNATTDFTAKTINSSKINLVVSGGQDLIDAFTIDVGSFGTAENAARSTYFRVRDVGAGYGIPFIIKGNGYVGIGTTNPTSLLTVAGNINSREVKVTVDAGADFVFEKDYNLPSLDSVDKFIKENKHLPEIASAEEMKKDGINLSEMNIKLLQKMEEMTLYMIEQEKKNNKQSQEIEVLQQRLSKLENQLK
ncbi:tail fiber protein [Flavobacterium sp. N1736]|uniref:tail fiber protein n=1 Tax=Flavobacterium sp. N1736 TaxID=2986823 RepID=UPI0022241BAC|nr:tail fiber protein [Flavobacterium sp. N1736]